MITIGVDFHKQTSHYCVVDSEGQRLKQCRLENRPELIQQFLDELPGPKQLAMEATRNWGLFYETVKPHVDHFLLGHPRKMKVITESETKHDRKDAQMIAELARTHFLPQAYTCSLETRQLRGLLRYRHFLVNHRRAIRNQTQILLDRNLWPFERPQSFKNIFCERGLRWLQRIPLPEKERFVLEGLLQTFQELSEKIHSLEVFIQAQACSLPGIEFLRTVPGFKRSKVHLFIVLTETADIHRFRKARHFAHYAGLIPSEHSSGDKHRTGRLVKAANHFLRTALIESTFGALKADRSLRVYYQSVKKRWAVALPSLPVPVNSVMRSIMCLKTKPLINRFRHRLPVGLSLSPQKDKNKRVFAALGGEFYFSWPDSPAHSIGAWLQACKNNKHGHNDFIGGRLKPFININWQLPRSV